MDFVTELAAHIKAFFAPHGQPGQRWPLHEPMFAGNEEAYVVDCIKTGWVSSAGSYVDAFERQLESLTGARHAVAMVNGTAALQLALVVSGLEADDEVLVPALTFVGTVNAIRHARGVPHFVEIETSTLGVDAEKLRDWLVRYTMPDARGRRNKLTGRVITTLVPVHIFGHPCRIEQLCRLAQEFGLDVVEDAAESLGSLVGGRHTGRFGRLAALSFNGNKTVTTGGGGAIITDDATLAEKARHLSKTGRRSDGLDFYHDVTAWNYRLPNINAALGVAQVENLPAKLAYKRALSMAYKKHLAQKINLASFHDEPEGTHSNFWLVALRLGDELAGRRDEVLTALHNDGIEARPIWRPMHMLPMHVDCPRMPLPVTEDAAMRVINLPSGPAVARLITRPSA